MEKAAEMLSLDGQIKKRIWGQFWSAHQVCMKRTTTKLLQNYYKTINDLDSTFGFHHALTDIILFVDFSFTLCILE